MSQVIVSKNPNMIINIRTSGAESRLSAEIEIMWNTEKLGDTDWVMWLDHYAQERFSQRYPTIAKYIADNELTDEITIYNFW